MYHFTSHLNFEKYSEQEFIRLHQYLRIGYIVNLGVSKRRIKVVSASSGRFGRFTAYSHCYVCDFEYVITNI